MATYKVTMFFQDNTNSTGWTESYYVNQSTAAGALTAAGTVATARLGLLMATSSINAIRASNVDSTRDSLYASTGFPAAGAVVAATYPQAGVWDALLVTWQNVADQMFGHTFLHAVPAIIFTGRAYNASGYATWNTDFLAWVAAVIAQGFLKKIKGPTYSAIATGLPTRRTVRRLGRPFDALHGRRSVA